MPIDFEKMKEGLKRGLEKGLETAKDGLDIASEKSAKFVEIQKIKSQVSSLNSNIKQTYSDLGRKVYSLKDTDLGQREELKAFIDEITRMYEEIEEKNAEIEKIREGSADTDASVQPEQEENQDGNAGE